MRARERKTERERERELCTDTVLVHETDEVSLGEQVRLRRRPLFELELVRFELFADLEIGQVIAVPLVVDVNVEIVSLSHDETFLMSTEREEKRGQPKSTARAERLKRRGKRLPFAEKCSPAISISTVVSLPRAFFEQHPRNLLTMSSYTRLSSPARLLTYEVGWIGGWALSFFLPLRGRSNPFAFTKLSR